MAERIILQTIQQGESFTARDEDGRLIAREAATRDKFNKKITLTIDGHEVTVPQSLPATDFLGNIIREADGLAKPRSTTIYDAARQLVADEVWTEEDLAERIPVLCHRDHLNPVAVCRMCSVHVCKYSRGAGRFQATDKLIPACQHEVQPGIQITTWKGGVKGQDSEKYAAQVTKSIKLVTELLVAENLQPQPENDKRSVNELQIMADMLNVTEARPAIRNRIDRNTNLHAKSRPLDLVNEVDKDLPYSARSILVDHDRCILCDRCARSCSDVKPFKIIGHTGKGYKTRISFDLDAIMNDSNCVQCGECMTACPTGALTLKRRVAPRAFGDAPPIPEDPTVPLPTGAGFLTADEMLAVKLDYIEEGVHKHFYPFRTIPYSWLKWNEGAVRRRVVKPGEILCRQGDFGSTAFLLKGGSFDLHSRGKDPEPVKPGFFGRLFGTAPVPPRELGPKFLTIGSDALILGELACLSHQPRTASIVAATDGEVYELTRNVLDMTQRSPSAREVLGGIYRRNAVSSCLREGRLFQNLNADERSFVASFLNTPGGAELRRVEPGETVVAEGAPADDFYIVRRGFLKVVKTSGGAEKVLARLKKDDHFGEIALLSEHPLVKAELKGMNTRVRTASVVALDPVEVIRIPGEVFDGLCQVQPGIRDHLAEACVKILHGNKAGRKLQDDTLGDFLNQGLFQGQKMLVLDLVKCTRCDECTKACADSHGDGNARLLREGQRFGDYLVATSCRSCHKPYCMEGCPVDAIHRSATSLEVLIDNHCIGCGLCEKNCPYGAIQLVPKVEGVSERGMTAKVEKRAVNCDLCHDLVPAGADPFCVAACPHDAAFRWSGEELLLKTKEIATGL